MKLVVEINNFSKAPVGKDFFVKVLKETLTASESDFLREKNVSISVAMLPPEEIQKLNKDYRKKDEATDVLSFAEYDSRASLEKVVDNEVFLGELILCYNDIKEYAQVNCLSVQLELATVLSHGLLHLLGFSHSPKMFALQRAVAAKVTTKADR